MKKFQYHHLAVPRTALIIMATLVITILATGKKTNEIDIDTGRMRFRIHILGICVRESHYDSALSELARTRGIVHQSIGRYRTTYASGLFSHISPYFDYSGIDYKLRNYIVALSQSGIGDNEKSRIIGQLYKALEADRSLELRETIFKLSSSLLANNERPE